MHVAITGGTGMVGTWLANELRQRGDTVKIVTRRSPTSEDEVQWSASRGILDIGRLEGIDAVYNLTGAPIADRPWTRARRQELRESRVEATQTFLESLKRLDKPPKTFIGVGGLGYYGDRGEEILVDEDPVGTGFLAELSQEWEAAHLAAKSVLGCRAAVLRMSIVISPSGGAFPLMVKPFRLGIGGWLGNGRQYTAWISIRDAAGAFLHILDDERCEGPFNGTVPEPVRNKEWCKALGRALKRPVLTHAPKWALRGALGELADDLFLASCRAVPRKLQHAGYRFVDPNIEEVFRWAVAEIDESAAAERQARKNRKPRPA